MSDIAIVLTGLFGIAGLGFFLLMRESRKTEVVQVYPAPQAVHYQPPPERRLPPAPVMEMTSQVLLQGVAQQISSIGLNEAFDVEHILTDTGQKVRFARVGLPPLVRPMGQPQITHSDNQEKELRKLRKAAERVAANCGGVRINQQLDVDGVPCMMKKADKGYDLFLIKPDGALQFMAHLGGPA